MTRVLQVVARADGSPTSLAGQYVRRFDPDADHGRGNLLTTTDLAEALVFDSVGEAMDYWQHQSTVKPLRDDGRPNRPLTAFTVAVVSP